MFKFLHTSDIHLDSPLKFFLKDRGVSPHFPTNATRQALQNIVNLAISEKVDFMLISGDLYDGDWKDFNTGLFLHKEMVRLLEHNIRVFIISGNHDAESQITRDLRMPQNVHRFSVSEPETKILDDIGVAIHGQGFISRSVYQDLSASYPDPVLSCFNIGMLHTSLNGRQGHEPYAPCTVASLLSKKYDYWALGHVHSMEIVHKNPFIIFPGNTQGRNIRETGAKGCTIVTVRDKDNVNVNHYTTDLIRWELCNIDAKGVQGVDDLLFSLKENFKSLVDKNSGYPVVARVNIYGKCQAHKDFAAHPSKWTAEIEAAAAEASYGLLLIEKVNLGTEADINMDELIRSGDPIGELIQFIQGIESLDEVVSPIRSELTNLKGMAPSEILFGDDAIDIELKGDCRAIIEEAKQMLISRLMDRQK